MKCHKHYEMDAVSQCLDCGKALCPECTNKFNTPLCESCVLKRVSETRKLLIRNVILMVVFFVIGMTIEAGLGQKLLYGLFFAGVPWGWSALNKITPNIFLFMPIIGWAIYFFIKFFISMAIGIFITPFKVYSIIRGFKDSANVENYIKTANVQE